MSAASSSMPHPGSARLTLRVSSIWPGEDGPARRLQIPSNTDEDTNACTTSLSMRRSGCNQNLWRTRPGKPSSVSSMDPRPSPGSKKTGPTLWRGSGKHLVRALNWSIHAIQHAIAVQLVPQPALKVRPARSFRRLRNAGPISAPGVQMPPSPSTSRTRQRALSVIILLVEP